MICNTFESDTDPTSTTSEQVPKMKSDAEAAGERQPDTSANETKPDAQMPASAEQHSTGTSPTEQEALIWIDKPVYGSDGKQLGKVAAIQRYPDNKVPGMGADIGGSLGFGVSRVNLTPAQLKLQGDRVLCSALRLQRRTIFQRFRNNHQAAP